MRVHKDQVGRTEQCVYLPEERSKMHYRSIEGCTAEAYQAMLERGWRRFGSVFFRPVCAGCRECRSLRIPVATFEPNRSMRRTLKRNHDLEVELGRPALSHDHLELYRRYHADMAGRRGWHERPNIDPFDYYYTFVEGAGSYGHQLTYHHEGRLLGVALVDILPDAVSAVYCYYDPAERQRSIGVFSVLQHLELARRHGCPFVYLGYWIEPNASMRYKARYRPHQVLTGRPEADEEPEWNPDMAGVRSPPSEEVG